MDSTTRTIRLLNFEGKGYDFDSTSGFSDEELRRIYRNALPRGTGWEKPEFNNIRSFKGFPLPNHQIAISEIIPTGKKDDRGRGGVLNATIQVFDQVNYVDKLNSLLDILYSEGQPTKQISFSVLNLFRQLLTHGQIRFVAPYNGPQNWCSVEIAVLESLLKLPGYLKTRISFSTFSLSYYNEAHIVGIPLQGSSTYDDSYILLKI